MKTRYLALAAFYLASPVAGALAQQSTSPDLGAANKKEATDLKDGAGANNKTPGATGKAVVPGSRSTVSGDKTGTTATKTDSTASGGGSK